MAATARRRFLVKWDATERTWTLNGFPMRAMRCLKDRQLAELVWSVYGLVDVEIDRTGTATDTILIAP